MLGEIRYGLMHLSGIGKLVEQCWRAMPEHFNALDVRTFQIMPNHVHGIIVIKEQQRASVVGAEYIQRGKRVNEDVSRRGLPRLPSKGL